MTTLSPKEIKLTRASLRYSLNAVEDKIKQGRYYPVEKGSHNAEALEGLINTGAIYAKLLNDIKDL